MRAKGEIIILNQNEMFNVPNVAVPGLKHFSITVVNICDTFTVWYEEHKLPSVVTRDLALSHESRLPPRHSRLAIRNSRLSMLSDSWSAG